MSHSTSNVFQYKVWVDYDLPLLLGELRAYVTVREAKKISKDLEFWFQSSGQPFGCRYSQFG